MRIWSRCQLFICFGDWSRQYKNRGEKDKKMVEDTKWKVLVRRVASAKAMSSLSQSKKKKSEVLFKEEAEDLIRIRNKLMWIYNICVFIRLYSERLLEAINYLSRKVYLFVICLSDWLIGLNLSMSNPLNLSFCLVGRII